MPTRRRPAGYPTPRTGRVLTGAVLSIVTVSTLAACGSSAPPEPTPKGRPAPAGTYAPQLERNADFLGENPLTPAEVHDIATQDGWFTMAKFADHDDLAKQFADATTLMTAAKAAGNPDLHIDLYFNASFRLAMDSGWGSYGAGFDPAWLLHDSSGADIPYLGQGKAAAGTPLGDVLDLRNPAYRAWAVATVTSWMHAAPVKGITLDSSDLLVGSAVRGDVGTGHQTWNDMLCGAGAPVDADGDCSVVAQWNTGLAQLLQQMTAALAPLGDSVTFNGVAPSPQRTPARNTELFADASHADNEGFCMRPENTTRSNAVPTTLTSVPDDVTMMQQQAAAGHGITEIVNFGKQSRPGLASYCAGAFLMGWQPGLDRLVFHQGYADTLGGAYPEVPEMDLAVGSPTGQATDHDGVLTRAFTQGFVAVDTTDAGETVTLPTAMTEFAGGRELQTYAAGATVHLDGQSADYFLSDAFLAGLHPGTTSSSGALSG